MSPHNTPILPVKSSDGTYRFVQDLREVNKRTVNRYPVGPNPYTLLSNIPPSHRWFSVIDLKDAFWACPLNAGCWLPAGFVCPQAGRLAQARSLSPWRLTVQIPKPLLAAGYLTKLKWYQLLVISALFMVLALLLAKAPWQAVASRSSRRRERWEGSPGVPQRWLIGRSVKGSSDGSSGQNGLKQPLI